MESGDFGRALIMSSDLRGYGRGNNKRHEAMQHGFIDLHESAAAQAGLNRKRWAIQPGGDGELAVLPASEPDPLVVDQYIRALHRGLISHNESLAAEDRLQLRVALAFGTAYPLVNGYAGQAVVEASRLADWQPLKQIFDKRADANIILILSQRVFEDVVQQGNTSYQVSDFHRATVREKEFSGTAWVWAPEVNSGDLRFLSDSTESKGRTESAGISTHQQAEVITNMNGPVDARRAVFGISRK
ncbi:hypothetical protein [Streptosporangium subroseum]|uniref:hypothetical protein n=1 Tax=Streptosporangium subroseum TaxID=106412 RepID=UPI00308600B4|nr:hypothetical protein OHB15_49445 [Streptosporangium subroseum]